MRGQRRYGTSTATTSAVAAGGDGDSLVTIPRSEPAIIEGTQDRSEGRPSTEREPLLSGISGGGRNGGTGRNWDRCFVGSVAVENSNDPFAKGSQRRDNGRILTCVLVLNYMIGSGILNSSQVFSESGISAATVLYITAGACVCARARRGGWSVVIGVQPPPPRCDNMPSRRLRFLQKYKANCGAIGSWPLLMSVLCTHKC